MYNIVHCTTVVVEWSWHINLVSNGYDRMIFSKCSRFAFAKCMSLMFVQCFHYLFNYIFFSRISLKDGWIHIELGMHNCHNRLVTDMININSIQRRLYVSINLNDCFCPTIQNDTSLINYK